MYVCLLFPWVLARMPDGVRGSSSRHWCHCPPGCFAVMMFAFQPMTDTDCFPLTVSMTFILKTRSSKVYFCTDVSLDEPLLAPNVYVIFISVL